MARTRRRKKRTHLTDAEDPAKKGQPKSFVLLRGRHAAVLKDLELDIRKVMSPNTATRLRESKRNVLKDFVHVAGPLGVTHFVLLSATHNAAYMRVAKSPRGPTLTMRIHEYSLVRDVLSSQQRPRAPKSIWMTPPLVVLSGFNSPSVPKADVEHLKLTTIMFQNMFPSINATTTKLSSCQRVLLLEYSPTTQRISFRHYSVATAPSGVTKSLKSLVARRQLPDMGNFADVSEFLTRSGYGSESEGEDAEASRVELPAGSEKTSGGDGVRQTRIRLHEIGPRMELEVIKVEESLCDGRVLFHRYVHKTAGEEKAQEDEMEIKRKEKERRRRQQEENVKKKEAEKRRKEEAKLVSGGRQDTRGSAGGGKPGEGGKRKKGKREWWEIEEHKKGSGSGMGGGGDQNQDDDAEWYRREVGEAPDEDFAGGKKSSLRKNIGKRSGTESWRGVGKKQKDGRDGRGGGDKVKERRSHKKQRKA